MQLSSELLLSGMQLSGIHCTTTVLNNIYKYIYKYMSNYLTIAISYSYKFSNLMMAISYPYRFFRVNPKIIGFGQKSFKKHDNFVSLQVFETKPKITQWPKTSLQSIAISYPYRFLRRNPNHCVPSKSLKSMKISYPCRFSDYI